MAHMTGANTTPLGRLHPVLAGKQSPSVLVEKHGAKRSSMENKTGIYLLDLIVRYHVNFTYDCDCIL